MTPARYRSVSVANRRAREYRVAADETTLQEDAYEVSARRSYPAPAGNTPHRLPDPERSR